MNQAAQKNKNMTSVLATYQALGNDTSLYFAPLLPWQEQAWEKLTSHVKRLAHGLLFSGMKGIGKHAFVWHLSAWMLCDDRSALGACGQCQSCLWLKAGTHPHLMVLPHSSTLLVNTAPNESSNEGGANKAAKRAAKRAKNNAKSKTKSAKTDDKSSEIKADKIKIDDIRALTPFVSQRSRGQRICIIDNADTMTVAAANALLKTLEEPNDGVHLFLISDAPAKLLPTIKSRVQKIPIDHIDLKIAQDFLLRATQLQVTQRQGSEESKHTNIESGANNNQVQQLLQLASGAPLAALQLIDTPWYDKRQLWLTTWLALRSGKRSSTTASDYWRKQLSLKDYVRLSEIMLMDIKRVHLGMNAKQKDLKFDTIECITHLPFDSLQQVTEVINDIALAIQQNVQEKLGYDKLMAQLAKM